MRAGKLNREITIEKWTGETEAVYGTQVFGWEPLVALPGSPVVAERFAAEIEDVQPSRDEALIRNELAFARRLTRVRLRWRDDINATMRVTIHGDTDRVLQIVGGPSEVGGRKAMIELMCEEVTS